MFTFEPLLPAPFGLPVSPGIMDCKPLAAKPEWTVPRQAVVSVAVSDDAIEKKLRWNPTSAGSPVLFEVFVSDWKAFSAKRTIRSLGDGSLARTRADACFVRLQGRAGGSQPGPDLFANICLAGEMEIVQDGASSRVRAGDIVVIDPTRAHRSIQNASHEFFFLRIPRERMDASLLTNEHDAPLIIPSSSAIAVAVCAMTRLAWSRSTRMTTTAGQGMLDTIIAAIGEGLAAHDPWGNQASAHVRAMLRRAKTIIFEHYPDPTFGPGQLAALMKISPRYLTALFEPLGVSPEKFILRMRLHKAWDLLTDPTTPASIELVSRSVGFNQPNYFARTMKNEFDMSPRQIAQTYRPVDRASR